MFIHFAKSRLLLLKIAGLAFPVLELQAVALAVGIRLTINTTL